MKSIFDAARRDELLARLSRLTPESSRRWGSMTPHQAVCHLSDSLKGVLGDRSIERRPVGWKRRILRFVAFTLPLPWPKGVQTSPEVMAGAGGTPPEDFERDVEELESLVRRFAETDGRGLGPHYAWGEMSRGVWGRYGYRHLDHHLRQFGV